jgi:predicted nucleotidyltransferase
LWAKLKVAAEGGLADYAFLRKLKALPAVRRIFLFGSRARGDFDP